ncbi:hypothetical protein E2C01_021632 [Portunus trituberculatus]|uniref:Uncharacterized protein n=1 Tax=Portunus trituberculatus TaxID=210409 RepID=A0A5B7E505_PORTR|nr:hypothetical protein [Portunus trituberculatus]
MHNCPKVEGEDRGILVALRLLAGTLATRPNVQRFLHHSNDPYTTVKITYTKATTPIPPRRLLYHKNDPYTTATITYTKVTTPTPKWADLVKLFMHISHSNRPATRGSGCRRRLGSTQGKCYHEHMDTDAAPPRLSHARRPRPSGTSHSQSYPQTDSH